ncbi:hypothetical protein PSTG_09173 [Puccinia striiformis f. sp. tritici PST-78]|uniref:Uncharacterized protein n=1 Tax=Puccinia striiformis f. sp. tritici PST-78 TaxID=1165861 RepID=A0A0L0VE85_9BASI|nr:hypothetical protein PSTG_09173 [Puccinia striiformis f. sp. tritici PST-78]
MPYRLTQNPSPLIPSVPQLDGNSVTFPAWRSRLEDVLAIQGVLDIVQGKVPRPKEQPTDSKPILAQPSSLRFRLTYLSAIKI